MMPTDPVGKLLTAAMSDLPSPLKSAAASPDGLDPAGYETGGRNVRTTRSSRPSSPAQNRERPARSSRLPGRLDDRWLPLMCSRRRRWNIEELLFDKPARD